MKKITLGLVALMTLFLTTSASAQDAAGCGIPAASTAPATTTVTYFTVPDNSTGGQSVEFTEDTLLETVTYEFQFSDLVTGGAAFADIQVGTLTDGAFGISFNALVTSATFEIPTSGSGNSPIITTDFSASSITLSAGQEYWIRVRGKATAGGVIGEPFALKNSEAGNGYTDGSFYRTITGVDVGIQDQSVDVFFEVVASGIEAPANSANSAVTETTADFSWDSETDTTYEAKVVAEGAGDAAADIGSTTVTGATASATGLTAETGYDFYVRATGTCGGTAYESDWVLVDFTTATLSADDFQLSKAILSPNPARSQVQILGINSIDKVTVYNMLGAKILSTNQTTINTSSLKAGLYLLQIESAGASTTKRLVIK